MPAGAATGLTSDQPTRTGAMRFMTGDPEVPILVRLCRNLLLTEAGLLLLVALFLLAARGLSGGTVTLDGGIGVGAEAAVYLGLAVVVVVIGVNVGRLVAWARWAAIALEVLLIVFLANEWLHARGSNVVLFLLAIVIIGLLLSPQASQGFAAAAAERGAPERLTGQTTDRVAPSGQGEAGRNTEESGGSV